MNRISFAVAAAVTFAGTAFATDSMVRELFPCFEVGEVVDGTKAVDKGLVLDWQLDAQSELGACAQFVFEDQNLSEMLCLSAILSIPDGKVLSMRIDARCETNEDAEDLFEDLIAMFKPFECPKSEGTKILEFNWIDDTTIFFRLSEKDFGFRLHELIENDDTAENRAVKDGRRGTGWTGSTAEQARRH